MFKINDHVIYGTCGVCKIIDINYCNFNDTKRKYYIMKPLYTKNSKIYVPVENERKMLKNLLSTEEVHALIKTMPVKKSIWIKQNQQRNAAFRDIIKKGNRQELVELISTLYLYKTDLAKTGKNLNMSDESIMKEAEKMLYEEFAFVLNIKLDEVVPYIKKSLIHNKMQSE